MSTKSLYTLSILFTIVLFFASLSIGVANFSWANVFSGSLNDSTQVMLISRLPRTFAILLAGCVYGRGGHDYADFAEKSLC